MNHKKSYVLPIGIVLVVIILIAIGAYAAQSVSKSTITHAQLHPLKSSSDIVYITDTGTKYHRASCSSLKKSKIKTTRGELVALAWVCAGCPNVPDQPQKSAVANTPTKVPAPTFKLALKPTVYKYNDGVPVDEQPLLGDIGYIVSFDKKLAWLADSADDAADFWKSVAIHDKTEVTDLATSHRIVPIAHGTQIKVIDYKDIYVKVRLTSGEATGAVGWITCDWLCKTKPEK